MHTFSRHSVHQQTKNCVHKQTEARKAWNGNAHAKLHINKWMYHCKSTFQLSLWSQPYWQACSITQYNCTEQISDTGFATPKANTVEQYQLWDLCPCYCQFRMIWQCTNMRTCSALWSQKPSEMQRCFNSDKHICTGNLQSSTSHVLSLLQNKHEMMLTDIFLVFLLL